MPLYITNFDYDNTIVKTTALDRLGLQVLFYKQETGPFGFCSDELSSQILKNIIINSLWYSIKTGEFYNVTDSVFEKNKYDFKGVLILIEAEFTSEIIEAQESIKLGIYILS